MTAATTTTCARCLDGRHRCLTTGCACSCNGPRRTAPKVVTGGMMRADRPRRPAKVPGRKPGRPRIHPVKVKPDPAAVEAAKLARQVAAVDRVRDQAAAASRDIDTDLLARLEAEAAGDPTPTSTEDVETARTVYGIADLLRRYQLTGSMA